MALTMNMNEFDDFTLSGSSPRHSYTGLLLDGLDVPQSDVCAEILSRMQIQGSKQHGRRKTVSPPPSMAATRRADSDEISEASTSNLSDCEEPQTADVQDLDDLFVYKERVLPKEKQQTEDDLFVFKEITLPQEKLQTRADKEQEELAELCTGLILAERTESPDSEEVKRLKQQIAELKSQSKSAASEVELMENRSVPAWEARMMESVALSLMIPTEDELGSVGPVDAIWDDSRFRDVAEELAVDGLAFAGSFYASTDVFIPEMYAHQNSALFAC
eukprot:1067261-Rhodomonas_salina.1